jgi:YVTN family beta-propeller protein
VVATLPTGRGPHEVGISADGTRAMVTNYGQREPGSSLTLIDVPRAEVIGTIDLGDYRRPHGVVWLTDGRRVLVTAEDDKALLEVDVDQAKVTAAIDTGQEVSHMLALGGGRAFVANIGSGSVTVIDLDEAQRLANVPTGDGAEGVAVAAGGRQVWITNRAADTITVLDAASLEVLASFESEGFPIRATATAGGEVLVTRARAGDLMVYDTAELGKGRRVAFDLKASGFEGRLFGDRFGDSSVPIGVVVDGEGKRAWIAHANADVITEVDVEKGEILRLLTAGKEPDGMGYSPLAAGGHGVGGDE